MEEDPTGLLKIVSNVPGSQKIEMIWNNFMPSNDTEITSNPVISNLNDCLEEHAASNLEFLQMLENKDPLSQMTAPHQNLDLKKSLSRKKAGRVLSVMAS